LNNTDGQHRCAESIGGVQCIRLAFAHVREPRLKHRIRGRFTFDAIADRAKKLGIVSPADDLVVPSHR
jgi:hypothetical protein